MGPEASQSLNASASAQYQSADELLPLLYEELRRLAKIRMTSEKPGQTLQATALVHEAWLKIASNGRLQFANRRHFFKAAAEAMQRILIDAARRKQTAKHGANQPREELDKNELLLIDHFVPKAQTKKQIY